ncbi:hypothetical protein GA0115255_102501, partial [Streptomyces sp. Ncost-T6T-2b]
GAQIPIQGAGSQTVATNALASAAYRDSPVETILDANSEWHKSEVKPGSSKLFKSDYFKPNLGEAFARAVQERMLGGARKALIQSFGTDPQTVVEHCLSANNLRKARDTRLTLVTVVFGVLFLPGMLAWVIAFRIRDALNKSKDTAFKAVGTVLLAAFGVGALILVVKLPLDGFWALYFRGAVIAPVIGWLLAKRIAETSAKDLRARWEGLLSGTGVIAKIPEAVPKNPNETAREALRQGLEKLSAEQQSNAVFYAGPKGVLGMGTRWGSWQLAEELIPKDPTKEIHQFRSWDLIRIIHDQLKMLERGPLNTGGFPKPSVKHWIVSPIGENADAVTRPEGEDVATFQVEAPRDTADLQPPAVRQRRPALPGRPVHPVGRSAGDHHDDHRHRAPRDAARRGHRPRARSGARSVPHQAGGEDEDGQQDRPVLGDPGRPTGAGGRQGGRPARPCGPPSPGIRRCWTTWAERSCCPSRSDSGTPGRPSPGTTASWRTTRCAPPPRCCGRSTRRRCASSRRTASTPSASTAAR